MRVCILEKDTSVSQINLLSWLYEKKDVEEITFIKSKKQFLKIAEKDPPDIVFIRVCSDQPTGLSILETFYKSMKNTKVVFVSEIRDYALEAYNVGASGYLVEPIERKRFESCFSKLLGFKR